MKAFLLLLITIASTQAFLIQPTRSGILSTNRINTSHCRNRSTTTCHHAEQTDTTSSGVVTASPIPSEQIPTIKDFLSKAKELGPIGADLTEEQQQSLLDYAQTKLQPINPTSNPTSISLENGPSLHKLYYSNAKGGSSGKLGPLIGQVTQEFVDSTKFINAVEFLGGILRIALTANREILDGERIRVSFQSTAVSVLGKDVVTKEIQGKGVWKMLYVGVLEEGEGGKRQLVRVVLTPSLFVLVQDLE